MNELKSGWIDSQTRLNQLLEIAKSAALRQSNTEATVDVSAARYTVEFSVPDRPRNP